MSIDITIINSPENVTVGKSQHTFSEGVGSIGRGSNNTWVLDDPDKYMSTVHTQVEVENGQYVLTDLSTNGTFVNGSMEPLGKGNKVVLNHGDRFTISDYEFTVSFRQVESQTNDILSQPAESGPFADLGLSSGASNHQPPVISDDPFGSPFAETSPLIDSTFQVSQEETDPLAVLDKASAKESLPIQTSSNHFPDSGFADAGNAVSDSITWPNASVEGGLIPDDWDDDLLDDSFTKEKPSMTSDFSSIPASPPSNISHQDRQGSDFSSKPPPSSTNAEYLALKEENLALEHKNLSFENENKQLMTEIVKLKLQVKELQAAKKQTVSNNAKRELSLQDKTLIEAMGLSKWNLNDDKMLQISETVGLLVRETMKGMMRVLKFRKKIKEEFRINVTTIQPVENNPLKFSANIDDAMENMFIKENNAYKEPVEALKEGFQGVAEHQIAVLAGMQAAFRGMLDRLDPAKLENRFEKYKKSGLINLGSKGKNWESYMEYHKGLVDNLDDSFQHLFGYDFVQAYEDQMQRLASAKLSKKKK